MSDSHNNMIAYGFNDVTFGGDLDLTEAMISLRLRLDVNIESLGIKLSSIPNQAKY